MRDGQFVVHFQPKYNLSEDCVGGAEALIRWVHPYFGFMNPGQFIPLFEQNGFITRLDVFVLEEVCKALRFWVENGHKVVPVSINLSRRDLDKPGMAEELIGIVDRFGLSHHLIHFEITESCFSENPTLTIQCIQTLHRSGFIIELDDFGTGYTSLTTLSQLPIDILKIDLSIIRDDNPGSTRNVLEFTMQLAKIMHLKTVQGGVENEAQLSRLRELRCDYVQGYIFSRPLPKDDFSHFLNTHNIESCSA